jgi:transcriptional regulator with XRE-family HTH domain
MRNPRSNPVPKAKKPNRHVKSPMPKDAEIGQLIRAQRVAQRLSQTELANAIGVTFQQVQKYEKGVNRIGAGRLELIAETLGVTPSFFFGGANGGSKTDTAAIDAGIGLLRREGSVRLLEAYEEMEPAARRAFQALAELVAAAAPRQRSARRA